MIATQVSDENLRRIAAAARVIYPGVDKVGFDSRRLLPGDWAGVVSDELVAYAALYACDPIMGDPS